MTTSTLHGSKALITGAGAGIGRALALRLARLGAELCVLGRTRAKLESLRREVPSPASVHILDLDIGDDDSVLSLRPQLERLFGRLDILAHCAGVIRMGPLESVPAADIDAQFRINARAPLLVTQALLPLVRAARGQVVFVNSSVGVGAKERAGAYAASKHALKAIADTLRMEVNASGVRVISVFPGNTATDMQRQICRELGRPYDAEAMLRAEDVAIAVVDALMLPPSAEVTDVHIRPARKPSA